MLKFDMSEVTKNYGENWNHAQICKEMVNWAWITK